ncbi:cyclase family protein [Paraburkholderia lycopersici]|uniref:Kynurenine formamidase n=1 Tax=Paraburkholderia lycopersici TaxID=416944 RepID=A0A1G6QRN6_9BURK|nr:cyclase family protein [Paraburkholderia lycopersici]SDC95008.1 Kynurenine formamidase [Paraburkholderia lycopersici]
MAKEAWHRWGQDDEAGALRAIDPRKVRDAARLVTSGRVITLAQPISERTPVPHGRSAVMHFMNRDGGDYAAGGKRPGGFQFAEDTIVMPAHLGTHLDALCHVWYDDELYNGFSSNSIRSTVGASRCGIEKLPPIATRGLLFDVMRHRGAPLNAGEFIGLDELQTIAACANVKPEPGDVVLLRTGWFETHGSQADYFEGEPGLALDAAIWLAESGVAVIGADNYAIEAIPFPQGTVFPVHQRVIRDYGVLLLEGLVLDELAAAGQTAFFFTAAALPIVGGTASPLSPMAIL